MGLVSLLATVADLKASQKAGAISPVMPAGVILPYGGTSAPAGWLECNGQAVSETEYPELYAAISSNYNGQLNPTTGSNWAVPSAGQFRVPDMRGMFMRGEGTPSGLDAVTVGSHQVDKTKKNGLTVSGGTSSHSGTTTFATNGHTHTEGSIRAAIGAVDGNPGALGYPADNRNPNGRGPTTTAGGYTVIGQTYSTNTFSYNHYTQCYGITAGNSASGSVGISSTAASIGAGDDETRPMNRGVKYIIKT